MARTNCVVNFVTIMDVQFEIEGVLAVSLQKDAVGLNVFLL